MTVAHPVEDLLPVAEAHGGRSIAAAAQLPVCAGLGHSWGDGRA